FRSHDQRHAAPVRGDPCDLRDGRGTRRVLEAELRADQIHLPITKREAAYGRARMKADPIKTTGAIRNRLRGIDVCDVHAMHRKLDAPLRGTLARQQEQCTVSGSDIDKPGTVFQRIELPLPELQDGAVIVAVDAGRAGVQDPGAPEARPRFSAGMRTFARVAHVGGTGRGGPDRHRHHAFSATTMRGLWPTYGNTSCIR